MRRSPASHPLSPVQLAIAIMAMHAAAFAPGVSHAQAAEQAKAAEQAREAGQAPKAKGQPAEAGILPSITVQAPRPHESRAVIGGFGGEPEWRVPQQAERFDEQALKRAQVGRLADVIKLDASISASYNAAGYWDFLAVRGFVLDLTHNYRREGLPISGETSLPLDNKAVIEILKGTSGMQAGISSPGGLMNLIVKRPEGRVREATLGFTGDRGVLTAVDLSDRFGAGQAFGLRVNAAHEHLHPSVRQSRGARHLLALAGDWRIGQGTLIEAEVEQSRRSQRSATGFSLLGNRVPLASGIDPDINLNNQPWVKPVVMRGMTGTLRLTHQLAESWKLQGTVGEQRLKTDDSTAFPFGGLCNTADNFSNCDRFSSAGEFSVWDFRSEGESRVTRSADVHLEGEDIHLGTTKHTLAFGMLRTLVRVDLPTASFNQISPGKGNITGNYSVDEAPLYTSAQNLRDERSTELYVRDSIRFDDAWQAWAGLRHTRLTRAQTPSDFSVGTSKAQENLTTPWLALGYQFAAQHQAYVSWGEGVELPLARFSTPVTFYGNSGQVLPAQKSRQWEVGAKGRREDASWSLNYFRIVKPEASSVPAGAGYDFVADGEALHQGIEGRYRRRIHGYAIDLSAMVMDAERRGSAKPGINGKAPVNVPDYTVKMGHSWRVGAVSGLTLQGDIVHEGPRTADAVNGLRIPAWTRVDVGMSHAQPVGREQAVTWRIGVTNLFDARAWIESPTQFDHIYLFPMMARTVTASMQLSF